MKAFLNEIPLYTPFKLGQSIIISVHECIFEISKKKRGFYIIQNPDFESKLTLKFKDVNSFEYLFGSRDLAEYGNRLVELSTQKKLVMDLGSIIDPMKRGFHRFIGYVKKTKGLKAYVCVVPTF